MNMTGFLSGKRKCLLAIAVAFSTFVNAQLATYPAGLDTGMPHNDDYTVKVRQVGGEWKDVFEYEVRVDMDKVQSASMVQFDMGEPVEVIDSFFQNAPADARPLWFLGKSLDTAYGKFQRYIFHTDKTSISLH